MDCRFYYLWAFILEARGDSFPWHQVLSCPSIWATLSVTRSIMSISSFQLFLHSDQPLSEGEIIQFSGVCQSGEAALSTPEAVVASRTDWQTALMCNRRRPAATSSRRASFSVYNARTLLCIFASSAATSRRICMSVIAAFASFSSLAFLSRWAL